MKKVLFGLAVLSAACGPAVSGKTSKERALLDVKQFIQQNLDALALSSKTLCDAAPAAKPTGWAGETAAIEAMKTQWKNARPAYEHVEGAIAVLFQELDVSTDERYDGFLSNGADDNLFDETGVTGIHAIERILWSDSIPASVETFEKGLPGYVKAAFPANEAQAIAFKTKLCARLVTETAKMRDDFAPLALDTAAAYRGVIGSMEEQVEKLNKASTGEEESRYAQFTLADMRANVEGAKATFNAFRPWLLEVNGSHVDDEIRTAFDRLDAVYAQYAGDSLPQVPSTWSSMNPSTADRATPFGMLFTGVSREADPSQDGTLVYDLNESAQMLGIPQLPQ